MLLLVAAAVRRFLPRPSVSGNTTTLRTIYDGANAWADFSNTNVLQTRYLFTRAIDEVLARLSNTNILAWDLPDLLGSVRDISDGPGTAVIDHIKYDSYGNILAETAPSAGDRFKYTAREWDTATSQYFNRARYYSSTAGRFTSQDPLGFGGGDANISRYVYNAPSIGVDPSGTIIVISDPGGLVTNPGGFVVPRGELIDAILSEVGNHLRVQDGKIIVTDDENGLTPLEQEIKKLVDEPTVTTIRVAPGTPPSFDPATKIIELPSDIIPFKDERPTGAPLPTTAYGPGYPKPSAPVPISRRHTHVIALFHELGHRLEELEGYNGPYHGPNSASLKLENLAREELGLPPRVRYDDGHF